MRNAAQQHYRRGPRSVLANPAGLCEIPALIRTGPQWHLPRSCQSIIRNTAPERGFGVMRQTRLKPACEPKPKLRAISAREVGRARVRAALSERAGQLPIGAVTIHSLRETGGRNELEPSVDDHSELDDLVSAMVKAGGLCVEQDGGPRLLTHGERGRAAGD